MTIYVWGTDEDEALEIAGMGAAIEYKTEQDARKHDPTNESYAPNLYKIEVIKI